MFLEAEYCQYEKIKKIRYDHDVKDGKGPFALLKC